MQALRYNCHYDGLDNFIIQVSGKKSFIILHPNEAANLYPKKNDKRRSQVDFMEEVLSIKQKYPSFQKAKGFIHHLEPGDAFFLPRFWCNITNMCKHKSVLHFSC